MLKKRLMELKQAIDGQETNGIVFGRTFFVMKKTATGYEKFNRDHEPYLDGTEKVYNSVKSAVDASQSNDQVIIAPGVYDEGAVINIDQEGLKIKGSGESGYMWGPCSLKMSAADHIGITVNATGVSITGFDFIQNNAKPCISLATTVSIYKTLIRGCHMGGGTYGVYTGDTWDAVDTVIEGCETYNASVAGIRMNGTRNKTLRNYIVVPASGIGIEYVPTAGNRPDSLIHKNLIQGTDSGDTGIEITGTPTKGTFMCSENLIVGCATAITQKTNNRYHCVNNYEGSTAGGALIDTSSE